MFGGESRCAGIKKIFFLAFTLMYAVSHAIIKIFLTFIADKGHIITVIYAV